MKRWWKATEGIRFMAFVFIAAIIWLAVVIWLGP